MNEYIFVATQYKRETLGAFEREKIEHVFLFGERIHTEIMGLDSHSADFEG